MSFGFFSGFYEIILAELHIDPQLESTIRPKAQGLHSIWNAILRITFSIWFFHQTARVLTVKIRQPSHEFTFGVGMSFIPYPLVLTPVV
jgi:hypothetical protein